MWYIVVSYRKFLFKKNWP